MTPQKKTLRQIFGIPVTVLVISLAGLVIALLLDGLADIAAAAAAALPIAVIIWALSTR